MMVNKMRKKKHVKTNRIAVLLILVIIAIMSLIIINSSSKKENNNIEEVTSKDDIKPVITLTKGEKVIIAKRRKIYS